MNFKQMLPHLIFNVLGYALLAVLDFNLVGLAAIFSSGKFILPITLFLTIPLIIFLNSYYLGQKELKFNLVYSMLTALLFVPFAYFFLAPSYLILVIPYMLLAVVSNMLGIPREEKEKE